MSEKLNIWREGDYGRLRAKLVIHREALDDEVIELPELVAEVNEIAIAAGARADRFAHERKLKAYQVSADLREDGSKRSEAALSAAVELDEEVQEATLKADKARTSYQFWSRLCDAFRSKQSSLKRLAELMGAGYMASSSVSDVRKNQAEHRARQKEGRPRLEG